jgi:hypothetical protein
MQSTGEARGASGDAGYERGPLLTRVFYDTDAHHPAKPDPLKNGSIRVMCYLLVTVFAWEENHGVVCDSMHRACNGLGYVPNWYLYEPESLREEAWKAKPTKMIGGFFLSSYALWPRISRDGFS